MPLIKIGKKYSVSNTSVEKWCKKYNIDYKSISPYSQLQSNICIVENCTSNRVKHNKYCRNHLNKRKRENNRIRKEQCTFRDTTYPCICSKCGKEFEGGEKDQRFCSRECYLDTVNIFSLNEHINGKDENTNNKLSKNNIFEYINSDDNEYKDNKVMFYLDLNKENKCLTNIILLNKEDYDKLNAYMCSSFDIVSSIVEHTKSNLDFNKVMINLVNKYLRKNNIHYTKLSDV